MIEMTLHSPYAPAKVVDAIRAQAEREQLVCTVDGFTCTLEPQDDAAWVLPHQRARRLHVRATATADPAGETVVRITERYEDDLVLPFVIGIVFAAVVVFLMKTWWVSTFVIAAVASAVFIAASVHRRANEHLTVHHPIASHLVGCVETAALRSLTVS